MLRLSKDAVIVLDGKRKLIKAGYFLLDGVGPAQGYAVGQDAEVLAGGERYLIEAGDRLRVISGLYGHKIKASEKAIDKLMQAVFDNAELEWNPSDPKFQELAHDVLGFVPKATEWDNLLATSAQNDQLIKVLMACGSAGTYCGTEVTAGSPSDGSPSDNISEKRKALLKEQEKKNAKTRVKPFYTKLINYLVSSSGESYAWMPLQEIFTRHAKYVGPDNPSYYSRLTKLFADKPVLWEGDGRSMKEYLFFMTKNDLEKAREKVDKLFEKYKLKKKASDFF